MSRLPLVLKVEFWWLGIDFNRLSVLMSDSEDLTLER